MDANKQLRKASYTTSNKSSNLSPPNRRSQLLTTFLLATLTLALVSDLAKLFDDQQVFGGAGSGGHKLAAWASWIGEVPTAAELYGDAASEMPTTESFDDDDEDEELDASASNEYPDNENENDESYEDPEGEQESEQESRRSERWLRTSKPTKTPAAQVGGHAVWSDMEGWRRNKRDIEDRIVLASRRAAQRRKSPGGGADDEFNVEDGDEDAWVHDGIDDIHIDPETKRAASELSYDEQSIDADYDPHQKQQDARNAGVINRTRTTTITDVIPMSQDSLDDGGDRDAASGISSRFMEPPPRSVVATGALPPVFVPAAYLSLEEAQRLIEQRPLASRGDRLRRDRPTTGGGSGAAADPVDRVRVQDEHQ